MITLLVVSLTIAGALVVVARTEAGTAVLDWFRGQAQRPTDTFVCKLRAGGRRGWPRRRSRATWIHNVLMVRSAGFFPRALALPVRLPEDVVRAAKPEEIRGLGPRPVVITLRLDHGPVMDVASAQEDCTALVGPFLAAAIPGLPRAPAEKLRRKPNNRPLGSLDPKERD